MNVGEVNEASTGTISATCYSAGVAVTPTSVSYKINDLESGAVVRTSTNGTPANPTLIGLATSDTAIIATTARSEVKRMTVTFGFSGGGVLNEEYDYTVNNLKFVT